jgi:anti-anti-sigma factor
MKLLAIGPELTIYQVRDLAARLLQGFADGARGIDLSSVCEMDTAGYQLLVSLSHHAHAQGESITLVSPSPCVREVLASTGDRTLHVSAS